MKKILASDYDNTFYINDEDIKKNIISIKEFIKDNIFAIATGRSFYDIETEIIKYDIPYDYLIINHGATIINNNKVLKDIIINNQFKNKLIEELKLNKADFSYTSSGFESRLNLDNDNLTKIFVSYNDSNNAIRTYIQLKKYNGIKSYLINDRYHNNAAIEIVSIDADKANAIKFIAEKEKITKDNIFTIGDNHNDLEMVKTFHGYAVENAIDEIKKYALKTYPNVSELIDDIEEND